MTDDKADGGADRQFVTSLARGLQIITAFRPDDRALSNQELAGRTGLPRPTVARFTHTLRKLNYLVYHGRIARYSLTPRVIELGQAGLVSTGLRDIARPAMESLAELGPFAVALGVPTDGGIRYLELARRPEAIVLNLEAGAIVPILQTAIGRAYLADLPEGPRTKVLERLQSGEPELFAMQERQLSAEIDRFAERGYVASFGGWWPELNAAATTIRATDDGDPLLLSISGLSSTLTSERIEQDYAAALMGAAQVIQSRMRRIYPQQA